MPALTRRLHAAPWGLATGTALLLLASLPAAAGEPIATDRPDFTESAVVVPKGRLQLESGLTFSNQDLTLPELLARYGLSERWELRLGTPNRVRNRPDRRWGWSDAYVGAKYQVGPLPGGIDLSLIPAIYIPTGSRGFSSRAVDPELKICYARDLSSRWSLSGMTHLFGATLDGQRRFGTQQTVSFGYGITERFKWFGEYAGVWTKAQPSDQVLHTGFTYLLSENTQIDLHGGFGLTPAAPDAFIAAGYSVRF